MLEDLHWADDATVELLLFLVPQLPPGLTLICTYRGEDLPEGSPLLRLSGRLPGAAGGAHVALQALDRSQARELVSSILKTDEVSASIADYVFEASGGLPFALEELLRMLEDTPELLSGRRLLPPPRSRSSECRVRSATRSSSGSTGWRPRPAGRCRPPRC